MKISFIEKLPHGFTACASFILIFLALQLWSIHSLNRVMISTVIIISATGLLLQNRPARIFSLMVFIITECMSFFWLMMESGLRHRMPYEALFGVFCSLAGIIMLCKKTTGRTAHGNRTGKPGGTTTDIGNLCGWALAVPFALAIVISLGFYCLTAKSRYEINRQYRELINTKGASLQPNHEDLLEISNLHPNDAKIGKITFSWDISKAKILPASGNTVYCSYKKSQWNLDYSDPAPYGEYRGSREGMPELYWATNIIVWD